MTVAKIRFRPGIDKESTQFSADGGWFDCDKIRFRKGYPEQIGGWVKYRTDSFMGLCRSIHDWATAASEAYLGLGTNLKFYVEDGSGYFDVTPIRETTSAGDVTFAKVLDGEPDLTVTDTAHGAFQGDFVTFSGAASLGGNIVASVLNQEYQIASVTSPNEYLISAKDTNGDPVNASSLDTGNGGASVVGEYQIGVGAQDYTTTVGWGTGYYGQFNWGGLNANVSFENQLRLYSQDEFGDDLIFCPRLSSVYFWDQSVGTGTRAVDISTLGGASNTPTTVLQIMVSPVDRHVIAFGCDPISNPGVIDPLLVRWSDQESVVDWTPTITNSSGGQVLSSGTTIVGAIKTRQEVLVFTDTSIHSMRFSGSPFVFRFSIVSENISMLSPKAGIAVGDSVYFMEQDGFYIYRGAVTRLPCTVFNYVFDRIDKTQNYKVFSVSNRDDNEVTWFYQSTDGDDIDSYVTYNYQENVWTIGAFDRAAWHHAPTRTYPLAASNDKVNLLTNYLYNQEFGYDDEGAPMGSFIESGEVSIGDGDSFAFMRRILPDFSLSGDKNLASFTLSVKGKHFPMDDPVTLATGTVQYAPPRTKQVHVRVRAREIILRIDANAAGHGWTMGDFRFDLRTDGKR